MPKNNSVSASVW